MNVIIRMECPLRTCGWHLDEVPFEMPAAVADPVVVHALRLERTEDELRMHIEGHKLEEWVTEIMHLKDELARLRD